jgi:hypothetical protein
MSASGRSTSSFQYSKLAGSSTQARSEEERMFHIAVPPFRALRMIYFTTEEQHRTLLLLRGYQRNGGGKVGE